MNETENWESGDLHSAALLYQDHAGDFIGVEVRIKSGKPSNVYVFKDRKIQEDRLAAYAVNQAPGSRTEYAAVLRYLKSLLPLKS